MKNLPTKTFHKLSPAAMKFVVYAGRCLLIQCAAFCMLGALISAFDFNVNMARLFGITLFCALIITAAVTKYRAKGLALLVVPAVLLALLNMGLLTDEFRHIVNAITAHYSRWLPVPVLFSGDEPLAAGEITLAFVILGITTMFLLSITICFMHSTSLTVLVTIRYVLLAFVLMETPPDAIYLMGLIAVYITLMLTGAIYPDSLKKSTAIYIPAFILSFAFLGVVYLISPPARYERSDSFSAIRVAVSSIGEQVYRAMTGTQIQDRPENSWFNFPGGGVWRFNTNRINIADSGSRVMTGQTLLEIQASEPGTFYLRGFAMDTFDGRQWHADDDSLRTDSFHTTDAVAQSMPAILVSFHTTEHRHVTSSGLPSELFPDIDADSEVTVSIQITYDPQLPPAGMNMRRVNDITDVDYIPYYSIDQTVEHYMNMGKPIPPGSFDLAFYHIPDLDVLREGLPRDFFDLMTPYVFNNFYPPLKAAYTHIDPDTAEQLRRLAAQVGIAISSDHATLADEVARYIKSVGTYTLTPSAIPRDEDFVLYFLETSQEGYCIHYATAATLMLRALDVPARFVSGYTATVSQSDAQTLGVVALTDRNAHAWVEVLFEDVGWVPLEVTPGGGSAAAPVQTLPPTPQTPPPTEPPITTPTPQTDSATPAPTPTPQGPGETPATPFVLPDWARNILVFAGSLIALILAIAIRRRILTGLRKKQFAQSDTNQAVICMWRYAMKVSRGYTTPPDSMEELALKARFSNHKITEDERKLMLDFTRKYYVQAESGFNKPAYYWYKYILCLG